MTYLLQLQKAIAHTEQQECVDVAHKLPSGETKDYWEGWHECSLDLTYALSLGETACRQHLAAWTTDVVESTMDHGYLQRIEAVKLFMEKM